MNEKRKKINSNHIIAILLFIGVVCSRPMILGNNYSALGLVLLMGTAFIYTLKNGLKIIPGYWGILISIVIFFTYCIVQALILQSDQLQIAFQTYVILLGAAIAFYVLLTHPKVNYYFFRIFIIILCILTASYIVSFVLSLLIGWDGLLLLQYNYGYFTNSYIFFPFTITYGRGRFINIEIWRFLGIFRESGIAQVFYIWAFFMSDKYFKRRILVRVLLAISVFACFSTAGFIVFAVALVLSLNLKKIGKKRFISVVFLLFSLIYILGYAGGTRLTDKAEASVTDRMIAMESGIENFKNHPLFGVGFYSTDANSSIQSEISLIASSGQIGTVGIGLYFIIYLISYKNAKSKRRYIVALAPLFITALFFQPLVFSPVVYMLFFADYDDDKVSLENI